MKIIKLTAENFKKLRAVEITPTGNVVEITGRNGAGKTSVLDAIWAALGGTKHIQAVPIRKGATKGRIRLDLGELVVERRFTEKGSALTVESAEGARYTSPQNMLDKLLGALTFDPLGFVSQEASEQSETLRRLVPLEVDVDQLDALNRGDFERRTDLNREARTLRAQADGIVVPGDLPAAPVEIGAAIQRITEAAKFNGDLETRKVRREQASTDIEMKRETAARLRREARELMDQAEALDMEMANLANKLAEAPALPEPIDVEALRTQLDADQATNKLIDQAGRKRRFVGEAADLETQARALSEAIDARDQLKADAIAKAKMPVPGLGFGQGIVTFNGIPFDQASTAEQLRVSTAIAMAANPKLRVIRIREGSMLDEDGLALIAEMAATHDYQVWLEKVDSTGKVGVFIEDGSVLAVDGEPVVQAAAPAEKDKSPW